MNSSTTLTKIAPALLAAQKEMGNATKDKKNPFFKSTYATLNSVRETVTPALHKHGIVLLQLNVVNYEVNHPSKSYVQTTLLHESGEYITSDTEIVCKEANNAQSFGSAMSYARRFGLAAMLSIGAEDDDGAAASNTETTTVVSSGAGFGTFRKS
jgi:hypothetical protein